MPKKEKLEFKTRDKTTVKMTKDGLVEHNESTGSKKNISKRSQEFNIKDSGSDETSSVLDNDSKTSVNLKKKAIADDNSTDINASARKKQTKNYNKKKNSTASKNNDIKGSHYSIPITEETGAAEPLPTNKVLDVPVSINKLENNSIIDSEHTFGEENTKHSSVESGTIKTDRVSENNKLSHNKTTKYSHSKQDKMKVPDDNSKKIKPKNTKNESTAHSSSERNLPKTDKSHGDNQLNVDTATKYSLGKPSKFKTLDDNSEKTSPSDNTSKKLQHKTVTITDTDSHEVSKSAEPEQELAKKSEAAEERQEHSTKTINKTFSNTRLKETPNKNTVQKKNKLQFAEDEKAVKIGKYEKNSSNSKDNATADNVSEKEQAQGKTTLEETKKLRKTRVKAENSHKKLEQAQSNLPHKHKIKFDKQFDKDTGKVKRKLHFEEEIKSQHAHIKGALPLRPIKKGLNAGINYAHIKVYQVQHENVGVEAAHKGEILAEQGLRRAYRFHKTAPYRKVQKLEKETKKRQINYSYQKALHENPGCLGEQFAGRTTSPELKSNYISRFKQKQKIKKDYAKTMRESKKAVSTAKKTTDKIKDIAKRTVYVVRRHPMAAGIIAAILLIIFLIFSLFTSLSNVATSGLTTVAATSYLASENDIDNAELIYTEWEADLLFEAWDAKSTHRGFDEYVFNIGDVSHDPYELMAYLTVKYGTFTFADIEQELRQIFAEQYSLSFTEKTETRYTDEGEPYEVNILVVKLTARSFSDVIAGRLSSEEIKHFNILMQTKGNRQYLSNIFDFNWLYNVSSPYGYRIHPGRMGEQDAEHSTSPISGDKEYHKGVDIAVPIGTPIKAGHNGKVIFSGDNSGYGLVVVIESDEGLVSKYAHLSELSISLGQEVQKGEIIAKSGNTGYSTGAHLHLEIMKNGQYLNPLYFADTGDDGLGRLLPGSPGGIDFGDPGRPMGDGTYADLIAEAEKHLGKPYNLGSNGPDVFDCSSYVSWVLKYSGVKDVGRQTAQGLFNLSTPISSSDAMPGDLIFFTKTYSVARPVTHVGIYVGNGMMIHCGDPIQYTSINTPYWREHFYSFGRY